MADREVVYIANRGEIALRVARAAEELGWGAVIAFGGDGTVGPAAYLDGARMLAEAAASGCTLVHPGYGFLSESARFARRTAEAGLTFVGPSPAVLELLADKPRARELARRCDVPVLAGTTSPVSLEVATAFVARLSPPQRAVIKAAAGGGGRGMRRLADPAELPAAYAACQREAEAAFGDGSLYVERYLEGVRHIEVQIIGDGRAVRAVGERDCSLQRRYQKLMEVAPAPALSDELREATASAAVRMATEVGYAGVGTFEFLVDVDRGEFVFIEANPRLQVEHSVTEAVWGIDLVHAQLRLARGGALDALPCSRGPRGTAIQLRINLERQARDGSIKPAQGEVTELRWAGGPGIRVDCAGTVGARPDPRFDSLFGKLCVWSDGTFEAALRRARRALAETRVGGVDSSLPLLSALCRHPDVVRWAVHTTFVDAHGAELLAGVEPPVDDAGRGFSGREDGAAPSGVAIRAPLAGTVVAVEVRPGDPVRAGQGCVVLEALKLETVVSTPGPGTMERLTVAVGQVVAEGEVLGWLVPEEREDEGSVLAAEIDLDAIRPDLAEARARHAATLDAARPDRVARRHQRGGRTAREVLAALCDPGSFSEYGALAVAAQRRRHSEEQLRARTPADGIVTGTATINAEQVGSRAARCLVMVYDYTVLAGTQGMTGHKKMDRMFDLAANWGLPLVLFAEGGGGRPGDTDVAGVSFLDNHTFTKMARLRGRVPLIGVASGRCFAGNAALLGCSDVIVVTRKTSLGMAGPAMIEGAGMPPVAADAVGPAAMHAASGTVDIVVDDEMEAVQVAKRLLAYAQGPIEGAERPDPRVLRHLVPENRLRAYDVRPILDALFDVGSVLELGRDYGGAVVTAIARLHGRPIAALASDCRHLAGAIDSASARKAARFMELAARFRLPVVVLCDTPGFMVGTDAEREGLVRDAGALFAVGAGLSVPVLGVVLRRAYGLGAQALLAGGLDAPGLVVAWPSGELGAMGLEGAVRLAFAKELDAIPDAGQRAEAVKKMTDELHARGRAVNAATYFELDAVIDPAETAAWLVRGLIAAGRW